MIAGVMPASSPPPLLPGASRHWLDDASGVDHVPGWIAADAAEEVFEALLAELPLAGHEVTVFGRRHPQPRLTSWHADGGTAYTYSGLTLPGLPFGPALAGLRARLADALDRDLDSVLANLYRDGRDSMGWHRDDEPLFEEVPLIASVSLGGPRRFLIRPRGGGEKVEWQLGGGSLLVMWGRTQERFEHAVPKTARPVAPRLNLTFRPLARP